MFELNVLTAVPVGIIAAIIWLTVFLRKLLRNSKYLSVSSRQKVAVWVGAGLALIPSILIGAGAAVFLIHLVARPGPWVHLTFAISIAVSVGVLGAAVPLAVAWLMLSLMTRSSRIIGETARLGGKHD